MTKRTKYLCDFRIRRVMRKVASAHSMTFDEVSEIFKTACNK